MLKCTRCRRKFSTYPLHSNCVKCGGLLEYFPDEPITSIKNIFSKSTGFWRYKQLFPPVHQEISLGEGGTPLLKAKRLAKTLGIKNLYLKDETRNPTHSYRDRAASFLVSNAVEQGFKVLVSASNGNMGASLAAYCAKANLSCHVVVPKIVDIGKLAQMIAYDAIIQEYGNTVDDSIIAAEELAKELGWYQATAELNPFVIEAQKSISYEIYEQIGVPEWIVVSMGSGGTIYSIWKGFKDLKQAGLINSLPKMVGVQIEGCAPIVKRLNKDKALNSCNSSTHALAILVDNPIQSDLAYRAIRESNGLAVTQSDTKIIEAEMNIAKLEGVFAEPASSAVVAALEELVKENKVSAESSVVCLITGSGLKATDVLQALSKKQKTAGFGLEISTKEKILRIIKDKETYGYDLWKQLGKIMTRGAVYQHLNALAEKGLIVGVETEGKKIFRITEQGKRVLLAFDDLKLLM